MSFLKLKVQTFIYNNIKIVNKINLIITKFYFASTSSCGTE